MLFCSSGGKNGLLDLLTNSTAIFKGLKKESIFKGNGKIIWNIIYIVNYNVYIVYTFYIYIVNIIYWIYITTFE